MPQGESYPSFSRSRNGTASNASGPSTPAPVHVPVGEQLERDHRVDRGLPHDRLRAVLAPSSRRCRPRGTGTPRAGAPSVPVPGHPRARARLAVHAVAELGRDRAAPRRRRRAARPRRPRTVDRRRSRRGRSCASTCSTSMNSSPSPYLNVTRWQSTQRGISSTSSCSTFTHSTAPMPSGNTNVSGSENGGSREPAAVLLPDHRRVQALLDRRPDRERRREVVALDHEVGAVAHADLVDLARRGGRPRSAANTSERPGSTPMPTSASSPLLPRRRRRRTARRRASRRAARTGRSGCGSDSVIAMSR